jgi:hypothetical protein
LKIIFDTIVSFADVSRYLDGNFGINSMMITVVTEDHVKRQSHQKQEENKSKINTDKEENITHGFIRSCITETAIYKLK